MCQYSSNGLKTILVHSFNKPVIDFYFITNVKPILIDGVEIKLSKIKNLGLFHTILQCMSN